MKGISTVVATILMLAITIALAGTAYLYISGTFAGQTAVVLSITDATCTVSPALINVTVSNDGTTTSGGVTLSATTPTGASAGTVFTCSPGSANTIIAGGSINCGLTRTATGAGTYSVRVSAAGTRPATGPVPCTG